MDESSKTRLSRVTGLPTQVLLVILRLYKQLFSPFFTGSCRFVPSCSSYAEEALLRYGLVWGVWLTVGRLMRCHPFCEGGLDQVSGPGPWWPAARRITKQRGAH